MFRYRVDNSKRYADKGTLVHSMLAIYYTLRALEPSKDRYTHAAATIALIKKNKLIRKAGFEKDFEQLMLDRFQQYLFRYDKGDFVPTLNNGILGVETPFAVKLYEDDEKIFLLEGRIDLLSKINALPIFVDHKTQLRFSELYTRKIQFQCYALATGYENGVVNYFGLQKVYKEHHTIRQKLFHIPKKTTAEFKRYIVNEVYEKIWEIQRKEKYRSEWPKNLNACAGVFESWPCDFCQVCEQAHRPDIQEALKKQYYLKVKPWSPWNESAGADDFENFVEEETEVEE